MKWSVATVAWSHVIPSEEIKILSEENYFPSEENKNTDGVLIAAKKKTGSNARSVLPELSIKYWDYLFQVNWNAKPV